MSQDKGDRAVAARVALGMSLAELHPEIEAIRASNEDEDGFLLHIFLAELAFWLTASAHADHDSVRAGGVADQVVQRLDAEYDKADEFICNAIVVSFLEKIMDDDEPAEGAVRSLLTPRLTALLAELKRCFRTQSGWVEPTGPWS